MFIAYTDASVKERNTYLSFVIVFEDKSIIHRAIIVDEQNSNIAEALAISELLSFLSYYNMRNGLILIDCNGIKNHFKKKRGKLYQHIPKNIGVTLKRLNTRTQLIPRKYNVAHRICSEDKFSKSNNIFEVNRSIYSVVPDYPEYFMQLSVLGEYRYLYKKPYATFHEAQMNLNKKIWLADLVEEIGDIKIYQIEDKRIKVNKDTIIKIIDIHYISIGNHWRTVRRSMKLRKIMKRG